MIITTNIAAQVQHDTSSIKPLSRPGYFPTRFLRDEPSIFHEEGNPLAYGAMTSSLSPIADHRGWFYTMKISINPNI